MDNGSSASPLQVETEAVNNVAFIRQRSRQNSPISRSASPIKASSPSTLMQPLKSKKSPQPVPSDGSDSEDGVPLIRKVSTSSNNVRKVAVESDDEDEVSAPTATARSSRLSSPVAGGNMKKSMKLKPKKEKVKEESSPMAVDEDESRPRKSRNLKKKRKSAVIEDSDDEEAEEEQAIAVAPEVEMDEDFDEPSSPVKRKKKTKKRAVAEDSDDSSGDDQPLIKKVKAKAPKAKKPAVTSPPAKRAKKEKPKKEKKSTDSELPADEEEDGEGVYKWWEQEEFDDSVKWNTLHHNGVYFPPEYVPHGVKMKYDGVPVKLSPASEEVAGFFGALIGTAYAENATFCKNFFIDFLKVLAKNDPDCAIKEFAKCDFTPMTEYFERQREIKKAMTKEEKEVLKQAKKELDDKFAFATIDGRKEKVGNFRIEPPGLFRGRGDHPKTGKLKLRVRPEDITINLSADAPVPVPPEGHQWGAIVHDNTVSWLATWNENVNNNTKYVFLAATSSLKGMSDLKKFEKARELKKLIKTIRKQYTDELKDKVMMVRQRATALWLIDRLALRAGNEKGEDEADTVGCCSLRFEHVELEEDSVEMTGSDGSVKTISRKMVVFDFLGKDSIRYYNRVEVDPVVWKNLNIFKRPPKVEGDPLFDRLTTSSVNKHLTTLMPGLTAKVFRTHNASSTFQEELKKTPVDGSVSDKVLAYNRANRQVAILCNHQRAVSKAFGTQMEKLDEKIMAMKYERHCIRKALIKADPTFKKKRKVDAEPESDMDDETVKRKHKDFIELEKQRHETRHAKLCEKAKQAGEAEPEKTKFELKDLGAGTAAQLEKRFDSISARIEQAKTQRIDKDENKTTALGTSKINYIDPRITAAWCRKYDVPVEKMFTKTLRDKFVWAMDMEADWEF